MGFCFCLKRGGCGGGLWCLCRRMEAKGSVGVGGGGGGEIRRIHVIYFLSRTGKIEHPHLIRVHHLSRNGVHLRDVKRWLSDLRGKDMPDSFSWSYKRRYKSGYVWQDLLEDDLITPISDNEYVLKGSEIQDPVSYGAKKKSQQKPEPLQDKHQQQPSQGEEETQGRKVNTLMDIISTKPALSEILEESGPFDSETSTTMTDDSIKFEDEKQYSKTSFQEIEEKQSDNVENISFSDDSDILKKKNKITKKGTKDTENITKNTPRPLLPPPPPTTTTATTKKDKNNSSGASHVFRNLLKCGIVDTNDSATRKINRVDKTSNNASSNKSGNSVEICKADSLNGSSHRTYGCSCAWNQKLQPHQSARKSTFGMKNKKSEFTNQKTVPAAYKPAGPNCSQCGKEFKPERMHSHMKSCRGMKAFMAKGSSTGCAAASAAEKTTSMRSIDTSSKEGTPFYLLTH